MNAQFPLRVSVNPANGEKRIVDKTGSVVCTMGHWHLEDAEKLVDVINRSLANELAKQW